MSKLDNTFDLISAKCRSAATMSYEEKIIVLLEIVSLAESQIDVSNKHETIKPKTPKPQLNYRG